MSWATIVHLILYHMTVAEKRSFFKFRSEICTFIDEHWKNLQPGKTRSATWRNTVSAVLSTHPTSFTSGVEELGQPGYWSLRDGSPPTKLPMKKGKAKGPPAKPTKPAKVRPETSLTRSSSVRSDTKGEVRDLSSSLASYEAALARSRTGESISDRLASIKMEPTSGPSTIASTLSPLSSINFTTSDEEAESGSGSDSGSAPGSDSELEDGSAVGATSPSSKRKRRTSVASSIASGDGDPTAAAAKRLRSDADPSETPLTKVRPMTPAEEAALLHDLVLEGAGLTVAAARLRRKLHIRHLKRTSGHLPLFDLDRQVQAELCRAHPTPVPSGVRTPLSPPPELAGYADTSATSYNDDGELVRREDTKSARPAARVTKVPYARSFAARLHGTALRASLLGTLESWASPYQGRTLKPFIRRDYSTKPPRMRLLEAIRRRGLAGLEAKVVLPTYPIDYSYVQPCHLVQVNALLSQAFWPGIDMAESLHAPEFSVVVLYRRLVIGCAFMTPNAYVTYITVAPGWENAGIGRFMLYHLNQISVGKDITLHVSANNPAMILYQGYGFKPEQFVVNFYDKYLPDDSRLSKNAFLLRLRR
ncbi:hypothetical protein IWQ60_005644 [Tieghemiomyces parasiticus]|uniref:N-acetyltransferase domain-containing protein n=1 Tax=Tieghemiomyces parasiticus TaxID=78921 RepID=A0A9W8A5S2_9FUNG|nr:hypothetical protein IWQ60_005644 [Tieghemiomyces parasiticus]